VCVVAVVVVVTDFFKKELPTPTRRWEWAFISGRTNHHQILQFGFCFDKHRHAHLMTFTAEK
jgi:hypothetical protein